MARPLTRRTFLAGTAAGIAVAQWQAAGALTRLGQPAVPGAPFTLGVASGDPTATSVVLWTRLAPDPLAGGGMPPADVAVSWEVATDAGFADVVRSGTAPAVAALGHSVHAEVGGLSPDTWYHYRFTAGGYESPVGRTRTTPPAGDCTTPLRFAFASCQSYPSGYYTAHANLADEGHDLVLFLGDYIYEGGQGTDVRTHNSPEVTDLVAYRNRYALYRGDLDLQASHAACPWGVIWDDHEVDNDYAGDVDQDDSPVAAFRQRRAAAYQAWYEHQPVRLAPPTGPDYRIYRDLAWGDLARFHLLDTRQYRADQACTTGALIDPPCDALDDPSRTMLGAEQEAWLTNGLRSSGATWNVVAQQVVFSALPLVGNYNMDQWDGYPLERDRIRDVMAGDDVANPVVITGDIHAAGIGRVLADWDLDGTAPQVATELVGTSITSRFSETFAQLAEAVISGIPWIEHVNVRQRGYVVCDVDRDSMVATYRVVDTTTSPTSAVSTDVAWEIPAGDPGAACTVAAPATTTTTAAPAATATPRFTG